jgi:predicted RNA-binding protein (virulence factor B family)
VPQLLTKEQKHERVRIRQECFLTTPTHKICHQLTLFLFLKVKEHLADTSLTQNHFQSILEWVTVTFTTEEVTAAYRR